MRSLFNKTLFRPRTSFRGLITSAKKIVLGIETSCDETGAAIVDTDGKILGEALQSQMKVHLEYGGVIPHIASYLHKEHIDDVVKSALKQSGIKLQDLSAISVATKPGLKGSLTVGVEYGKQLAKISGRPLIPIHHMEAHALTARMIENIEFPFVVLLASGGHCQIAVVKGVEDFLLLGTSQHNSPGEVLDKIARRLKLLNLPECYDKSGGHAIDFMAQSGDPTVYPFPPSMLRYRDCNFSFSGFGSYANVEIQKEEEKYGVPADGVIPNVQDFCASLLHSYAIHMMHRLQRAFIYCQQENIFPSSQQTLVFSGGVACNTYIRKALKQMCDSMNIRFCCPPPKLCTDNGIMIAWNGIEKLKANVGIESDTDNIQPDPDCPLGTDIRDSVAKASIKVKLPKLESMIKYKETVHATNS